MLLLLKDQILEEVCGVTGIRNRFAAQSPWPVPLQLLSASLREGLVTLVWYVCGTGGRSERGCHQRVAVGEWDGEEESGVGRGFVLRASDDVLIFISCY